MDWGWRIGFRNREKLLGLVFHPWSCLFIKEGKFFHFHQLNNYVNNYLYFNISNKLNKSCNLCFNSSEELIKLDEILPIIGNDFVQCFSFVDILYDRFAIKHSICINCSYDLNKKIKKEIKYHNSFNA